MTSSGRTQNFQSLPFHYLPKYCLIGTLWRHCFHPRCWLEEKKKQLPLHCKALQKCFSIRSAEHKSFCLPNFPILCLNFLLTFLWKAMFPLFLGIANLICSWQQCANIYCIKVPKQRENSHSFSNFISNGSQHFIRTSEAIQKKSKNQVSNYIVNIIQDESLN